MFSLTTEQEQQVSEWIKEQDRFLELQGKDTYGGACGGRFTYSFTPTSIGVIVKVSDGRSGATIDVTDYKSF